MNSKILCVAKHTFAIINRDWKVTSVREKGNEIAVLVDPLFLETSTRHKETHLWKESCHRPKGGPLVISFFLSPINYSYICHNSSSSNIFPISRSLVSSGSTNWAKPLFWDELSRHICLKQGLWTHKILWKLWERIAPPQNGKKENNQSHNGGSMCNPTLSAFFWGDYYASLLHVPSGATWCPNMGMPQWLDRL